MVKHLLHPLVGRFKSFSTIYSEKCCLFFQHFSLKKMVKFSVKNVWKTNNIFHCELLWKIWISQPVTVDLIVSHQSSNSDL
jgi:hypothetical protein